jgi:hypothetical protein
LNWSYPITIRVRPFFFKDLSVGFAVCFCYYSLYTTIPLPRGVDTLYLYSALIFVYFISLFIDAVSITYFVGILAIFSWILSLPGANRLYQVVGVTFTIIALGTYLLLQKPIMDIPLYMTSTVPVLAIFYVLPFINSIIIVGRYDQNVNKLLKVRVEHLGQLYYRGSLASFLLGSFLNIATVPLIQSVLSKNLKDKAAELRNRFISRVMLRGYALSLAWSPMEILVAISVDITGASYLMLLPWLLLFSLSLLMVDWLIGWRFRSYPVEHKEQEDGIPEKIDPRVIRRIGALLLYLGIFIGVVVVVTKVFLLSFVAAVTLVIVPYSVFWAFSINRFRLYFRYSIPVWKARTLSLKSYMVLFLSVGLFTGVLNESSLIGYVQDPIQSLAETPIFLFILIQCLFLGLAMVGFHPLVTISILGGILQPIIGMVHPVSMAIVLVTSGLSTVMAGPYNITVSLTANLLNVNPYKISWWNLAFAFLFSSVGSFLALLLL